MNKIKMEVQNLKARYEAIFKEAFNQISQRFDSDKEYKRWRKEVLFFFDVELKDKIQQLKNEIFKKKANTNAIVVVPVVN